jgi:hypothetical protein
MTMIAPVLVPLIVVSIVVALRPPRRLSLINRRPYNNHYSDATAARDGRY